MLKLTKEQFDALILFIKSVGEDSHVYRSSKLTHQRKLAALARLKVLILEKESEIK